MGMLKLLIAQLKKLERKMQAAAVQRVARACCCAAALRMAWRRTYQQP